MLGTVDDQHVLWSRARLGRLRSYITAAQTIPRYSLVSVLLVFRQFASKSNSMSACLHRTIANQYFEGFEALHASDKLKYSC
jgi:hypothetical protein